MPLLGFGTLPGGAVGSELQAVTRRAIIPAVVVQIGKYTPVLSAALAAAEGVSGGVSPVTIPVQGTRMVSGAFTDYSGSFATPQVLPGLTNAEYNLKAWVVGIPYYMFEGLVQVDADIIPVLWARMNDAGNYTSDQFATFMFNLPNVNTALQIWSLFDLVNNANPTIGNVGGIDRTANTWWQANVSTITSITGGSTAITRANVLAAIMFATKAAGGEPPTFGVCSNGFWAALATDVIGAERYVTSPDGAYGQATEGTQVAFNAITVGNVPIYADSYMPNGTDLLLLNMNYLGFKLHRDATFALAGPESLLPQSQLGYVMALFTLAELVCSKPSAQARITGFTGALSF